MTFPFEDVSRSFSEAGDEHDIIVVGSGYGGGVAASRLARAGQKVTVLERGREIKPGEYPRDMTKGLKEFQVSLSEDGTRFGKPDGLYDLHVGEDISVFVGCGVGGTSLINANVAIEPDPRVYANWPAPYSADPDALAPYYERARKMLGSNPYPEGRSRPKLDALETVAKGLGAPCIRPDINVSFEDGYNAAGVFQAACNDCGDCVSGCNYGAKNTVLMNYLPDAKMHGAEIFNGAKVLWIERIDPATDEDGKTWLVHVDAVAGKKSTILKADMVILAAGTLGSTEILARSADKGLALSEKLGAGFSGNGDVYAFGYNANLPGEDVERQPVYGVGAGVHDVQRGPDGADAAYKPGPCIIGAVDMRDPAKPLEEGVLIEEGAMPGALAPGYAATFPLHEALFGGLFRFGDAGVRLQDAAELGERLMSDPFGFAETVYDGPVSRTLPFLVMSHDGSDGTLTLKHDQITVEWAHVGTVPAIENDNKIMRDAADAIQAEFLPMPFWQDGFGKKLVSVHPLGGCIMGSSVETGVVNADCQVFDPDGDLHPGLYVCDGAVVPGSIGVNPHLTITALAERACEQMAHKNGWSFDTDRVTPPQTAPPLEDPPVVDDALQALKDIRDAVGAFRMAISARMYELAQMMLKGAWRQFEELFPKPEDQIKPPVLPRPEDVVRVLGTPVALKSIVAPILDQCLDLLDQAIDLVEAKDPGALIEMIEREMGDFSPEVSFHECMRGHITTLGTGDTPMPLPEDAFETFRDLPENAEFTADISADTVRKAIDVPGGLAEIKKGTFECDALEGSYKLTPGHFRFLMPDPDEVDRWEITYECGLESVNGTNDGELTFKGFKTLQARPGSHWWRDVTELSVTIKEGDRLVAHGLLKVSFQEVLRQANGLTVEYTEWRRLFALKKAYDAVKERVVEGRLDELPVLFEAHEFRSNCVVVGFGLLNNLIPGKKGKEIVELAYKAKIMGRLGGLVLRNYGGVYSYLQDFPGREAGSFGDHSLMEPEEFYPEVEPGKYVKLTRYHGGDLGPVMLAGGFGTRASSFATPTVDENIVQTLTRAGYDVWLFDYRGSGEIASSQSSFTLDDVARKDWPAAIDLVTRVTKAEKVQTVVHCIGSMTLFMAMLTGEDRVRSVISSQLATHAITNWFNFAKADSQIATAMRDGLPEKLWPALEFLKLEPELIKLAKDGIPVIEPRSSLEDEPSRLEQMIDVALWNVPNFAPVPCMSPTCHRINAIFGPSYRHEQLNQATHAAIRNMFGPVSSTPGVHIAKIFEAGYLVDAEGRDVYMGNIENLRIPIHFIAGARNPEMLPEATLRTYHWLRSDFDDADKLYSRHVYPDYGHMDCFIGKNASRDIFPDILAQLQARA